MFAVDVCGLPETGGSTFVVVAGLFVLVAGVIVARWVRQSAGRMSVVVAPLVLLGGLVLAPQVTDPCAPATTTVPSVTTVDATTTVPSATTTTTTTTTIALTCANGGTCVVGDPGPSGGTIFYKDLTRPAGSQYFEVACAGWSDGTCGGNDMTDPTSVWGCNGTQITGTGGTLIGTGEQHTIEIVNGCVTSDFTAAERADALLLGGLDDWFLPSKDELNALCKWAFNDTVNAICNNFGSGSLSLTNGGFSAGKYWSSSVYSANYAWTQLFNGGWQIAFLKTNEYYVRPVRAF